MTCASSAIPPLWPPPNQGVTAGICITFAFSSRSGTGSGTAFFSGTVLKSWEPRSLA